MLGKRERGRRRVTAQPRRTKLCSRSVTIISIQDPAVPEIPLTRKTENAGCIGDPFDSSQDKRRLITRNESRDSAAALASEFRRINERRLSHPAVCFNIGSSIPAVSCSRRVIYSRRRCTYWRIFYSAPQFLGRCSAGGSDTCAKRRHITASA